MRIERIAIAAALLALLAGAVLRPAPALAGGPASAKSDADEILDHIEHLLFDVEHAQAILNDPPRHRVDECRRAEELLRLREAELERARIGAMSAAAGVPRWRVAELREHGYSWYDIATRLDVSPRVVGLPGPVYGPWADRFHRHHYWHEGVVVIAREPGPRWRHDRWDYERWDDDHRRDGRWHDGHGHDGRNWRG